MMIINLQLTSEIMKDCFVCIKIDPVDFFRDVIAYMVVVLAVIIACLDGSVSIKCSFSNCYFLYQYTRLQIVFLTRFIYTNLLSYF